MLSLKPRQDLFSIAFSKDDFDSALITKYNALITPGEVVTNIIDAVNESITGITFSGIDSEPVEQSQHGSREQTETDYDILPHTSKLGHINIEPYHNIVYRQHGNPLNSFDKELTVSFRLNQGLLNYLFLQENLQKYISKQNTYEGIKQLTANILSDTGEIISSIELKDIVFKSISSLDLTFKQVGREEKEFTTSFLYNNIRITSGKHTTF